MNRVVWFDLPVTEKVTGIAPHGFRAVIMDSEGNRVALHSNTDQ